ncbi:MAG TPA: carboxypeptidase regulatory-like domain-containing protein, partial [Flavitalea sp.]|nr:carboxypeptidase regulatory-like domain-containing protein [Flavitalea sp.]
MSINVFKIFLLAFLLSSVQMNSFAQGTDASFAGTVKDESNGELLSGATVQVKNTMTGFVTTTLTNMKGEFSLKDLPLGGPYHLQIEYTGYQILLLKGFQLNLGDRIDLKAISLKRGADELQEVTVTANNFMNRKDRLGAGYAVTGKDIQRLPTTTRNYTELASLSPLTKGGSIGGAKDGGTGFLIDGVTNRRTAFGGPVGGAFPVSLETVREFEIVSNSYDVTNGRGSGGVIKAVTKSGTNQFHGTAWGFYSGNTLTGNKDVNGKTIRNDYSVKQYGANFSGPIIKDKLHFFVNFDSYQNTAPFRSFDFDYEGSTLAAAEKNLSITKANLDKVVSILQSDYGVPQVQQYGEISTKVLTNTFFARFDYTMNKSNSLTFRYNYQSFDDPRKRKTNGILSNQYRGYEADNSFMLSWRSQISKTAYNDFKLSIIKNKRENRLMYPRSPEGEVEVSSVLEDGSAVKRSIDFGNQNWVPEVVASTSYQLINNYNVKKGKFNFTFGTDNIFTNIKDQLTHNQQGKFYYSSLNDLQNNTPWRFERKIPVGDGGGPVNPQVMEMSLYGQMETNLRPGLTFDAGLRWDGTLLPAKPKYNSLLEKELGIRNDVAPFDADNIQPRLNLTWDLNNTGKHIFKIGAGWFASQFTTQAFTMAHMDNGTNFVNIDARGADVPPANWPSYYQDFNNVPGEDYLKSLNLASPPAAVIAMDKHLQTPVTFKANLTYHTYLTSWLRVGGGLYYNRINNNVIYQNINLVKNPSFVLGSESGREIYVPSGTLNGKDRADYLNSRVSDQFTTVL